MAHRRRYGRIIHEVVEIQILADVGSGRGGFDARLQSPRPRDTAQGARCLFLVLVVVFLACEILWLETG
jgi:hypothetical protein